MCDVIYSAFASRFGTKPFHCHSTSNSQYKPKKAKARSLCTSQQEHRSTDELWRLGLEHLRKYHMALNERKKFISKMEIARVRKECAHSFWKFVSKVLDDGESTPHVNPSLNNEEILPEELLYVIQKSRHPSSPSLFNQITYSIVKRCRALYPALLDIYDHCWQTSTIPSLWEKTSVILIPKKTAKGDPSNPANFRPIALTSCIGKFSPPS